VYQALEIANLSRQYGFLESIISTAIGIERPMVSSAMLKALNVHAIACLHVNAGQYRPGAVEVGKIQPPHHYRVPDLMEDLINELNFSWHNTDQVTLAAYALWRLCLIHPFINGNGRTARALAYYIVCAKSGGLLRGSPTLPELIRSNPDEYVAALRAADQNYPNEGYLKELHSFLARLLDQQLASADPPPVPPAPSANT